MLKDDALVNENSPFFKKEKEYALSVFDFYVCYLCKSPYYGGKHECAQGVEVYTYIYTITTFLVTTDLPYYLPMSYRLHLCWYDAVFIVVHSFYDWHKQMRE